MKKLIIIGASGHGKVVADTVICRGEWRVLGFLDGQVVGVVVAGLSVLGRDDELAAVAEIQGCDSVCIGIGDNFTRELQMDRCRAAVSELSFPTVVHPAAVIASDVSLGEGTVVVGGAVVNVSARVGRGCILNTKSSLDHDCVMEDFASLAPGVTVGGESFVGRGAAIGIGATVLNRVRIGAGTVVGAGSTVIHDLPPGVIAYGTPARIVRERQASDPYLAVHTRVNKPM